jgi:hypothetical protein
MILLPPRPAFAAGPSQKWRFVSLFFGLACLLLYIAVEIRKDYAVAPVQVPSAL